MLDNMDFWIKLAAALGALVVAVLTIWGKAVAPALAWFHGAATATGRWIVAAGSSPMRVARIEGELKVNGGGSLKDAVLRIERDVNLNAQRRLIAAHFDPVPQFEADATGSLVWVNAAYTKLIGRDFDELRGRGWFGCIEHGQRDSFIRELFHCAKDQRELRRDVRLLPATGEAVDVVCRAYPMRASSAGTGDVVGFFGHLIPHAAAMPPGAGAGAH